MYRSSFDSPSPSLQLNLRHFVLNSINLDMENLFDESPVKEVALVKAKKVTKRRQKAKMTINKEVSKPWTAAEEGALCKDFTIEWSGLEFEDHSYLEKIVEDASNLQGKHKKRNAYEEGGSEVEVWTMRSDPEKLEEELGKAAFISSSRF
ncbi:hypothetical protein Tco_0698571 [Tanacetum coccineum]